MKKKGNAKAFAAYEEKVLGAREAWQFINALSVKILNYEPEKNRVEVEMLTEGRMQGSTWFVDPAAVGR